MSDPSLRQANQKWRLAMRRALIGSVVSFAVAYAPFGAVLGFTPETLRIFLLSTVAVWTALPWVSLDAYANAIEGRPQTRFAGIGEIHWSSMLMAYGLILGGVLTKPGYWSLAFFVLSGASISYCVSRMLLSAYERGRSVGDHHERSGESECG